MAPNKIDYKVISLDKDNYVIWKWQFINILKAKQMESVLKEGLKIDAGLDGRAMALLGSALSEENILKIINCGTFEDAWKTIQQCYENKTAYEPQSLYRKLNNYRIESASEVSQGVSELRGIAAKLKNLVEEVSENCLIGSILSALPKSFDVFVTVWRNSAESNVDDLVSKLMAEASDQASKEKEEVKALAARVQSRKGSKPDVSKDQCRYCKEEGHWLKDCPSLKGKYDPDHWKRKKQTNGDRRDQKGQRQDDQGPDLTWMAQCNAGGESVHMLAKDEFAADSGCTNSMSPYKELFVNLRPLTDHDVVMLADHGQMVIKGVGDIITDKGRFKDVYYVPELGQNLFSIYAAAQRGITHVGTKEELIFYHEKREVFKARLKCKMYVIKFNIKYPTEQERALAATERVWHARYAHVPIEIIREMKQKEIVKDLDIVAKDKAKCIECQLNKCSRVHHGKRASVKAKLPGQVLHLDTAGPSNVASRGKAKYFVLCKDEASRYRQVAFVEKKDEVPARVKEFITRATLETGQQVLKLVTDNGTEYINTELRKYLETRGIIHEKSVAYAAAQNGFIEREIRTVKEAAKTLLNQSGLDKNLWPEAIACAVYTLNRVINSANKQKTPYELWFGVKPSVKNLRIFGELAVTRKPQQAIKSSWDTKGDQAIFLGYTERFNTYRFLVNDKVTIACDATFLNKMSKGGSIAKSINREEFWTYDDEETDEEGSDVGHESSCSDMDTSRSASADLTVNKDESKSDDNSMRQLFVEQQSLPRSRVNESNVATVQVVNDETSITNDQVNNIVNGNQDQTLDIVQGDRTVQIRVSDMKFCEGTGRWKNSATGHFLSKQTLQTICSELTRHRANIARIVPRSIKIPQDYAEASNSKEAQNWEHAMSDEMNSLIDNEVYDVVPENMAHKEPVGSKWVYTIKYKKNGEVDKFKARIVAKGYTQRYGVDYWETYCSVVHIMSTRLILNYAAQKRLHMKQFDIKTAFLYGRLEEDIFMTPPEGYCQPRTVWRLKRSLYGLKQSPRMWNERFNEFMKSIGLTASKYDQSVFYRLEPIVFVIVYVDDGLIFAQNEQDITRIIEQLQTQFKVHQVEVNVYRGLEIVIENDRIFIHQAKYTKKIIEEFRMKDSNPTTNPASHVKEEDDQPLSPNVPYRSAVGSLAYLADTTRPDIALVVNQLQRKQSKPSQQDWNRAKNVFRYLRGTIGLGIEYQMGELPKRNLIGYSDSDYAGDKSSGHSTTGYLLMLNGSPFHWKSALQKHTSLSSTEAEVIALCTLTKEMSWIRRMIIELKILNDQPAVIRCDNTSALRIVKSEKFTARTRHLRAQDAYVLEQIAENELAMQHVKSKHQLADMLTKMLPTNKFVVNRDAILTYSEI